MTPTEYAENVAARFGGKLPGWHALAERENAAMIKVAFHGSDHPNSIHARKIVEENMEKVMAAIDGNPGMYGREIADAAGLTQDRCDAALRRLSRDKAAECRRQGKFARWYPT